ncbi:MAG: ATP-binding protein [Thermodesulfobacteriota bacterium]
MNPFELGEIRVDGPFCDREEEQRRLLECAGSGANAVVFGPRRFGKTSLVKRVQERLRAEQGGVAVYADLFRVTSVESVAQRVARSIYAGIHRHESLLDRGRRWLGLVRHFRPVLKPDFLDPAGLGVSVEAAPRGIPPLELLQAVFEDVGSFAERLGRPVCVALDEFQDIVDLREPEIEGLLRGVIQGQRVSYVFVGSRRRVLQDIFARRGRPFYQSAISLEVGALPLGELAGFMAGRFAAGGKHCHAEVARFMAEVVAGAPYYAQALGFLAFSGSSGECRPADAHDAMRRLLAQEQHGFEAILQGLTDVQVKILRGLAASPVESPTGKEFLARCGVSPGGAQKALKRLWELDLIERNKSLRLSDPVFALWLREE